MDFAFATVVTIAAIGEGEVLTKQNLWVKRPGTGSIPAEHYESLLGRKAARDLAVDVHLNPTDIS
jgi:N-acetylneuraminate synthase